MVGRDGTTILLAPGAYAARADEMSLADETVLVDGFGHFEPVDGHAQFVAAVATALRDLGTRPDATVALDPSWTPSRCSRRSAHAPSPTFGRAASARLLKTEREIGLLREAARVCDAAHDRLLEVAAAGRNELEVMGDVLTRADRAAGQPVPWAGELVSGPRTGRLRYPGGPVDRELERATRS